MSPRKLTEDDKQEILQLYRNSEATTSTLATRYEVSSSTISRFLKNKLTSSEYEELIQEKRLARTHKGEKTSEEGKKAKASSQPKKQPKSKSKAKQKKEESVVEPIPGLEVPQLDTESQPIPPRRRRRRSTVNSESTEPETIANQTNDLEESFQEQQPSELIIDHKSNGLPKIVVSDAKVVAIPKSDRPILKINRDEDNEDDDEDDDELDIITLKEMLGEDLEDINDEDDDEDDEDDDDDESITFPQSSSSLSDVQIRPLSQASLPRICYLVIDRSAELIVKPLADFADLGAIPQEEVKQRTLPVFDNHRIAKRFSHRRERVIKVPDGRMLQKTSHHLHNKGITRLLIDGQIYSLPI